LIFCFNFLEDTLAFLILYVPIVATARTFPPNLISILEKMSATTNKDPSVRASGQGKDITFWDKLDLVPGYLTVSQ